MSAPAGRRRCLPQAPAVAPVVAIDFGAQQFRAFAAERGYELPQNIEPGRRFRFSANGKRGDDAGWGILFADGEGGVIGDWRTGEKHVWQARRDRELSPEEHRAWQERIERAKREDAAEREREEEEAAKQAAGLLRLAQPATDEHPYLRRKGVRAHPGVAIGRWPQRDKSGCLLIPMKGADTKTWNVQAIFPDEDENLGRDRDFLFKGRKRGCYFGIGNRPNDGEPLCIAEGYATAASIYEATGYPAVVAFDAGNLQHVAAAMRAKYPQAQLVICADNDIADGRPNVGLEKAREAAKAIGARIAVPELDGAKCDFNDLAETKGLEAVKLAIEAQLSAPVGGDAAASDKNDAPVSKPPASSARSAEKPLVIVKRSPIDWHDLAGKEPPARRWAIKGWLGFGHTTLLVGSGGIGKTLLAQQAGSALALGSSFIDEVPGPQKALMWACEDDHDELWRRQVSIARWLAAPLGAFAENFVIVPRHGLENALVATEYGRPMFTPRIEELREQAGDYRADVVILDNAAQLYGGGENDRHAVTIFLNALSGALPGKAVLLLAHPARAAGSEFSGSSAWENVARTRLYLGAHLPDQKPGADEEPADGVRYLARRKANYSSRDWRRFSFRDGVLIPDAVEALGGAGGIVGHLREQAAERIVLEGLKRLQGMGIEAAESSASPQYLPRLLVDYKLAEGRSRKELAEAMRRLRISGQIVSVEIGKYANRSPKYGLRVVG
jgi:phage/plasmid primase-like uncharacterized protein/RecA-family ATPase